MPKHLEESKDELLVECAENLREVMFDRGFSAAKLAEEVGISKKTIENYTRGITPLYDAKAWVVIRMATVLNVDPRYLVAQMSREYYSKLDYIDRETKKAAREKLSERARRVYESLMDELAVEGYFERIKAKQNEYVRKATRKDK